jgi:hypothetical protein
MFLLDLSPGELRSTYLSYCFLAEFGRADEIWKRDAARHEIEARGLPVPKRPSESPSGLPDFA